MWVVRFAASTLWLIFFASDGDPPYPGFTGCFLTGSHKYDLVYLSVVTITWDSRKHDYSAQCLL